MLKATKEIESDYNLLKSFLLDTMKYTPNLQSMATWMFLTGSRIGETIFNYNTEMEVARSENGIPLRNPSGKVKVKKKEGGKVYANAFILPDIQVVEVNKGSGVWMLYVPYVLKRRGHSKVKKDELPGRWVPTEDRELLAVFLDYLENQRPLFRGENISNNVYSAPVRYPLMSLYALYLLKDELPPEMRVFVEKAKGRLYHFARSLQSKAYQWLLETKYDGLPYMDLLVFPMPRLSIWKYLNKYGYFIKGRLYDIATGKYLTDSRPLYTHFFREARVNTLYYEYEYTLEEIIAVMGWRSADTIAYYVRAYEKNIESAVNKMMSVAHKKAMEEMSEEEKQEFLQRIKEGKVAPTKRIEDIIYTPLDEDGRIPRPNVHAVDTIDGNSQVVGEFRKEVEEIIADIKNPKKLFELRPPEIKFV